VSKQYNDALITDLRCATNDKTLDAERNLALFQRVAAGDVAAREEMIVGNMPLAVAKVESFIRCYPGIAYLRDDLTSAAFVGLTKAVNQMAEGCQIKQPEHWNPTDCIGAWINRELSRLVEDETPIRVPHETDRLAKQKGEPIVPPTVCNATPERFETPSYQKQLEDRDLIESCAACDEERTMLAMWMKGHTNAEIGKAIHKSAESTRRLGKQLEARIRRKVEALRDE
jgi:hypothetical protein